MKRFYDKVLEAPSGCHLWTAYRVQDGYGRIRYRGRQSMAHRVAWELANGPIPDGLLVLHVCDRPECVNPAHLFLGTHADNMADRDRKGRTLAGDRHPSRKLSEAEVVEIRRLYAAGGTTQRELGERFGVTRRLIGYIIAGDRRSARK